VAGLLAGLLPNMLQVLPSAALSHGTYETMKQLLSVTTPVRGRQRRGPGGDQAM